MNTQKIKRKDLLGIYPTVCEGWKSRIVELMGTQDGPEIEVPNAMIAEAFKAADSSQKTMIKKYFDVTEPEPLRNKIKKAKDPVAMVFELAGKSMADVLPWSKPKNKNQASQNAKAIIEVITEVLNAGTVLDWMDGNQRKYFPYFIRKKSGWVVDVYRYGCGYGGLGFGCYYATSEDAMFAAEVFIDVYNDYLPE